MHRQPSALTQALLASSLALACAANAATLPRYDHVVVVIMENHSKGQIIGSSSAPYINSLAKAGANFTNSHGVTHPSQPNYVALFSGSTQGVTNDSCFTPINKPNLGAQLITAGLSFTGYSEDLPAVGSTTCKSGAYARKHNPWSDFSNVPAASNQPMTAFPSDFTKLPTVAFVVPNLNNDMHDGSVNTGDNWLKSKLSAYAEWAKTHNSLLIVTFDEDDSSTSANLIPTVFYGAGVKVGNVADNVNHYYILATLQGFYGLPSLNAAGPVTTPFVTTPGTLSLLQDGDFEAYDGSWQASTDVLSAAGSKPAHGGGRLAWLNGYGQAHTDTLSQSVDLPAGQQPLLRYWMRVDTNRTGTAAADTLKVQVKDASGRTTTLATFSNLHGSADYKSYALDLSAYAGQRVTLTFAGQETGGGKTSFLLDDVQIELH